MSVKTNQKISQTHPHLNVKSSQEINMLSINSIQTIDVLRAIVGNVPIYHRRDRMGRDLPCIVYSKTAACIIDARNQCRFECAHVTKADTVVYTDGGWKPHLKMGIVGIWYGHGDLRNERLEVDANDAFVVEMLAIIRVLERERYSTNESLEIRTDNRTCAGLFHKDNWIPPKDSIVIEHFYNLIEDYPRPLNIGWVRGHSDWMGNNEADQLTKKHCPSPDVQGQQRFMCHSSIPQTRSPSPIPQLPAPVEYALNSVPPPFCTSVMQPPSYIPPPNCYIPGPIMPEWAVPYNHGDVPFIPPYIPYCPQPFVPFVQAM